jgi:hypothetical protein
MERSGEGFRIHIRTRLTARNFCKILDLQWAKNNGKEFDEAGVKSFGRRVISGEWLH